MAVCDPVMSASRMSSVLSSPALPESQSTDRPAPGAGGGSEPGGAESIPLESLVHHRHALAAEVSLEKAHREFAAKKVDFMAVVQAGRVVGLCSRGQIGFVMGSRFGFSLYSQHTVDTVMAARPLIAPDDTPLRALLDRAFARQGEDFHEDVVLVDADGGLVGLLKVETLARLQSRLVSEQVDTLTQQREALRRQNLELFQTNHALRQSQGLYASLFESPAIGAALLEPDGHLHACNHRFGELLNVPREAACGRTMTSWIAESDRPAFGAVLREQASGRAAPLAREFTLQVEGRGLRVFRLWFGWIVETSQISVCFDDVTDQRMLERLTLRHEKQALLDTLVGGIAHELNNKLTPVQAFAELLNHDAGPSARRYTELIVKSTQESAAIIRQLLQLSKPVPQDTHVIDLRQVVDEALVMLRFQVREARCELRTVLPPAPAWVAADPAQIKQVVINLVLNALHALEACPAPAITLALAAGVAAWELAVEDNGVGIPAENLGRIFDPFFTTKGPKKGTGLGLSICYSIARQHGGDLSVESEAGRGARFTLVLPCAEAVPAVVAGGANPSETAPAGGDRTGVKVLVAEDEPVVARLLQETLRTHFGCHVDVAENGAEAQRLAAAGDYALVLSDVRMPVVNGIEFFRSLRGRRESLVRRFVFITGYPGRDSLDAELETLGAPVIAKPFTVSRLVEVCGSFLRRSPES